MLNRNTSEDLLQLKKRARRRLVGAITLVVFALIVLWTALDSTPPSNIAGSNSIEIISSSPALLQPVVTAAPEVASMAATQAPVVLTPQPDLAPPPQELTPAPVPQYRVASSTQSVLPGKLVNHQKKIVITPPPTPKPTPIALPDPQKILEGLDTTPSKQVALAEKNLSDKRYYIQIGAYADGDKAAQVVSKLKAEGVPAYSEKVTTEKGALTRVRVGPVKDEAKAQSYLKKMGVLGLSGHLSSK
ncbi:SPOR domain-containing protein [Iodobacter sp.]|uniref:SPOR domain-containing protein n=1 Tax=Iodobacter sp. TaxID=1915058 RepID=UPI0025D7BDD0|nr:SPOR domain-containing protein [Iodobacter sp.]